MKKFILALATFIFAFNFIKFPTSSINATTSTYMRVLSNDVYIYSDASLLNKLFIIPYSYYVKIESINGNVARVTYGDEGQKYPLIMGYMNIEDLTITNLTPLNPYAPMKVSTKLSDVLFNDSLLANAYFNVPENTFMIYYGNFLMENGSKIAYVYCNNKLGYFDESALNPFTIPLNQDPIPSTTTPPLGENEENNETETPSQTKLPAETLQIIIIIGLSIISISIVYALFKPSNKGVAKQESDYFEEEN